MSMLFSRTAIILVWLVMFGLFAVSVSPTVFAPGVVSLVLGGMALTTIFVLWRRFIPAIGMTAPNRPLPPLPSADFVPNSWPNSGFRNSRQRGTRGR
jgi:hypothetical protein